MHTQVIILCLASVALVRATGLHRTNNVGYAYGTPSQPLAFTPPSPVYNTPRLSFNAQPSSYRATGHSVKRQRGMPFDFSYDVQDRFQGLDFGHESNSDGEVVTGKYYVLLPDGRTQIVTYTADRFNGYQAQVTYEGEANYPQPQRYRPATSTSYSAPTSAFHNSRPSHAAQAFAPQSIYSTPRHQ